MLLHNGVPPNSMLEVWQEDGPSEFNLHRLTSSCTTLRELADLTQWKWRLTACCLRRHIFCSANDKEAETAVPHKLSSSSLGSLDSAATPVSSMLVPQRSKDLSESHEASGSNASTDVQSNMHSSSKCCSWAIAATPLSSIFVPPRLTLFNALPPQAERMR